MPELPEVQALSERLQIALERARFVGVDPLSFSGLKTVAPPMEDLIGRHVRSVGRRGKFLVIESDGLRVLIHLSQGGRIDLVPAARATRPKGGVVRFRFDREPAVLVKEFGTERKAGWWILLEGEDGPLAKLGPDALSEEFAELLRTGADSGRLHAMFRDQRVV